MKPEPDVDDLAPVGWGRLAFPGSRLGRAYGHDIVTDKDGVTRYCDDLSEVGEGNLRPCVLCGANPADFDGHDPCMANLPGVRNACCGHGIDEPYVEFEDGRVIIGPFKIARRRPWPYPTSYET
jgi:hypothetical protein